MSYCGMVTDTFGNPSTKHTTVTVPMQQHHQELSHPLANSIGQIWATHEYHRVAWVFPKNREHRCISISGLKEASSRSVSWPDPNVFLLRSLINPTTPLFAVRGPPKSLSVQPIPSRSQQRTWRFIFMGRRQLFEKYSLLDLWLHFQLL